MRRYVNMRPAHLVLLAVTLLWAILLWKGGQYGGFNNNDFALHERMVYRILAAFKHGNLGLDSWEDGIALGNSAFRTYQNLGHYLAAAFTWAAGLPYPSRSLHLVTMLALTLQCPAGYRAARLMGYSRDSALMVAWFCPLLSSTVYMSHQLQSYLLGGFGLYTQSLAFGPFLLALAWSAKLTGWGKHPRTNTLRQVLPLGFWISLSFLLHHFYGYMALLSFGFLAIFGAVLKWIRVRDLIKMGVVTAALFLLLCSYQLLSVLQDGPLVLAKSAFEGSERWDGLGFGKALELVLSGALLDWQRIHTITLLAYVGFFSAFAPGATRTFRTGRVGVMFLILGVLLFSGRTSYGSRLDWIPGFGQIMLVRTASLIQIALILLAATGASFFLSLARGRIEFLSDWSLRRREVVLVRGLALLLLVALVGYPFFERATFLRNTDSKIRTQAEINQTLDPQIFGSLHNELKRGSLWLPVLDFKAPDFYAPEKAINLGIIGYETIADYFDYPQIAQIHHHMSYPSEVAHLFKFKREYHYRLFNVQSVILKTSDQPPPFLKKIYSNKAVAVFTTPAVGMFDVVGVNKVLLVPKDQLYLDAVIPWVLGPESQVGHYPAIIPAAVVKRWPESVPKLTAQKTSDVPRHGWVWGQVNSWERVESGNYKAELEQTAAGAVGMLRTGYHPRWNIMVNGKKGVPRWVGPGFLGFDLEPGKNVVEINFPQDPIRAALFIVSMVTLIFCLMSLICVPEAYVWILQRALRWLPKLNSTDLAETI